MSGIRINHEKCTLCGTCIESCPFNALEIQDGKVEVNAACKLCKLCIKTCPEGAIYLEEVKVKAIDKSKYKGVLVFAEQVGGKIHPVTGIDRKRAGTCRKTRASDKLCMHRI